MPVLRILLPDGTERAETIDRPVVLGRGGDCDLVLANAGVSRRHARLAPDAAGHWYVEDLGSRNGTFLNGFAAGRQELADGDRLGFGGVVAVFLAADRPPEQPSRSQTGVTICPGPLEIQAAIEREPAAGPPEGRLLAGLYDVSRRLLDQSDVGGLIEVACASLTAALDAGAVVIGLTCDPQREQEAIFARPAAGAGVSLSLSVLRRTLDSGKAILIRETSCDADLAAARSIVMGGIRSAMCVPLMRDRAVTGFIYVDSRAGGRSYGAEDLDFAAAVGSLVGTAVEVARLHESEIIRQRLEAELQAAAKVQRSILPSAWPSVPGYEIHGMCSMCRQIGGDYYDTILDGDGRLWLFIADVCGKGAPAALQAGAVHAALHALAGRCSGPASLLVEMNRLLLRRQVDNSFVTCLAAVLDPRRHELRLASAGHPPPLFVGPAGEACELPASRAPMLGVFEALDARDVVWRFPDGPGCLLMYTDGASEAMNEQSTLFGEEELRRALSGLSSAGAAEVIDRVAEAIERFRGSCGQLDDLTLLACRRLPPAPPSGRSS